MVLDSLNYEIKNTKHKSIKNIEGYSITLNFKRELQVKPTYRFLMSIEQCVEKFNKDYFYVIIKISKEEKIGFKHENDDFYEEFTNEHFDKNKQFYQLEIFYKCKNQ